MSDDQKTKEQLLAELEALKKKLEEVDASRASMASTLVPSAPLTRRALSAWVAPVVLGLPVVGAVLKPGEARAANYYPPTDDEPPIIYLPTVAPTRSPTQSPTLAPPPTKAAAPPTRAGRCIPVPTTSPTLGMAAAPDSRPSPIGLVALGGARALALALG